LDSKQLNSSSKNVHLSQYRLTLLSSVNFFVQENLAVYESVNVKLHQLISW
jgi:hypothetical protein